jgi:hypothetical protein
MTQKQACDRCGYSRQSSYAGQGSSYVASHPLYTSSNHICDAAFEIIVFINRSLYLCNHHYRQHEAFIASRGYIVRPWSN